MSDFDLTTSQRTILSALVNLYSATEGHVGGKAIAEEINRHPGTVRNRMQSLKALHLVEGITGRKGGYKPTAAAYAALDVEQAANPTSVPLKHDGEAIENAIVEEITLTTVHHPELCRAKLYLQGSIRDILEGDSIKVGPTPQSKLVIEGIVSGKDDTSNVLVLRIKDMRAPSEN